MNGRRAKRKTKSPATAERYKQVSREFLGSLGNRAKLSLAHIRPKDIRAYRDTELPAAESPNTANLSFKIVSAAFNAALCAKAIWQTIPAPRSRAYGKKQQSVPRSHLEKLTKLVNSAEGDWKGAILLAYYTGARLRDVANMRWSAVDRKAAARHVHSWQDEKAGNNPASFEA